MFSKDLLQSCNQKWSFPSLRYDKRFLYDFKKEEEEKINIEI